MNKRGNYLTNTVDGSLKKPIIMKSYITISSVQ